MQTNLSSSSSYLPVLHFICLFSWIKSEVVKFVKLVMSLNYVQCLQLAEFISFTIWKWFTSLPFQWISSMPEEAPLLCLGTACTKIPCCAVYKLCSRTKMSTQNLIPFFFFLLLTKKVFLGENCFMLSSLID